MSLYLLAVHVYVLEQNVKYIAIVYNCEHLLFHLSFLDLV